MVIPGPPVKEIGALVLNHNVSNKEPIQEIKGDSFANFSKFANLRNINFNQSDMKID